MQIQELSVKLSLDDSHFNKGIEGSITKASAFGSFMGNIASQAVTGAFNLLGKGLGTVNDFLSDSVGLASDYSESMNAVNVVFEEGAGIIKDFGKKSAEMVGLSTKEFNKLSTVTGAFLTNLGYDSEEAAFQTIELTKRAADMASVFNTDVSQALAAVQSGLKGEFNPLEQFGVKLSAADIEAKALAMGLASTKAELDNNAKAQAALALIMEQTDKLSGDFRNTSDGLANSQRILAARFDDIKTKLGTALLPAIEDLTKKFAGLIDTPEFQAMIDGAVKALEGLGNWVTTNLPKWEENFRIWKDGVTEAFDKLGITWESSFKPALDELSRSWENLQTILNTLSPSVDGLPGKFTATGAAIRIVVGFVAYLTLGLQALAVFLSMVNTILETGTYLWDRYRDSIYGVAEALARLVLPSWLTTGIDIANAVNNATSNKPKAKTSGGRKTGRASGGPVIAGQMYNVLERGKDEIFTPNQSGRIDPAKPITVEIDEDRLATVIARVFGEQLQKRIA